MAMIPPTETEIAQVLRGLITGTLSRREASDWAEPWIIGDVQNIGDIAWSALKLLCAADLVSTDRPYLYNAVDFQTCLTQLEQNSP